MIIHIIRQEQGNGKAELHISGRKRLQPRNTDHEQPPTAVHGKTKTAVRDYTWDGCFADHSGC